MISTGLFTQGVIPMTAAPREDELDGPMVYLAPDRHAFLVLGDGEEPVITWSRSFRLARDQADIHGATVVAVPIVHDASWRGPHRDDPTTQVPAPMSKWVDRYGRPLVGPQPIDVVTPVPGKSVVELARAAVGPPYTFGPAGPIPMDTGAGYPLGRAAAAGGGGSDAGWSSARPDVVGQEQVSTAPDAGLTQRVRPFGDPEAPELPTDPEEALRRAFGGGHAPATEEAMTAFHTAAQADVATLTAVVAGLRRDDTPG